MQPISLLYDGFGHFLDILDGRDEASGMADVNVRELHNAVDDLANAMTQYSTVNISGGDTAAPHLLRIFSARSGTQIPQPQPAAIGSDSSRHQETHGIFTQTCPNSCALFPSHLLHKFPSSSDDYLTFEIQDFFPDGQPYRLSYIAQTPGADSARILIKFVQRYSIALHEFCAKSGRAPQILAFERLPGGWWAVAMEYIESACPIADAPDLRAHLNDWIENIKGLMSDFHDAGLVHGDLRDANIICNGDSVMLIDFDWSGKDGEVSYPTLQLNDELVRGRRFDNLIIRKEDDIHLLNYGVHAGYRMIKEYYWLELDI